MEASYDLGAGGVLNPGLYFRARSCAVDNPGGQWVRFPDVPAWIPPYHRGAVVTFASATNTPRADTVPPPGSFQQTGMFGGAPAQIGQPARLRFSSAAAAPSAGYALPIPAGFTTQYGYTQSGIPATDPFVLTPTTLNAPVGLSGAGFTWDVVSMTGALQAADLPGGVINAVLDVGYNNSLLGGWQQTYVTVPIPASGLIQQAWTPGAVRQQLPVQTSGAPTFWAVRVRSTGNQATLLTAGAIRLDLTLSIALPLV